MQKNAKQSKSSRGGKTRETKSLETLMILEATWEQASASMKKRASKYIASLKVRVKAATSREASRLRKRSAAVLRLLADQNTATVTTGSRSSQLEGSL